MTTHLSWFETCSVSSTGAEMAKVKRKRNTMESTPDFIVIKSNTIDSLTELSLYYRYVADLLRFVSSYILYVPILIIYLFNWELICQQL